MGMSEYTDQKRVKIAQQEYDEYNNGKPLKEGDPVSINHGKTTVGFVAEVHRKPSGEDSYGHEGFQRCDTGDCLVSGVVGDGGLHA